MTTLLFDADITCFQAAQSQEVATEKNGYWTWSCKFDDVRNSFDDRIQSYMTLLNADKFILFLSDEKNFRKGIYPPYKLLRERKKRPVVLKAFKKFLLEERRALVLPNLEGDDAIGIYATNGSVQDTEVIIVSEDKDLLGIPGYIYRKNEVVWQSKEDAERYHLYQTLIGDQTDGYPGLAGIGPKKAKDILDKDCSWEAVVKTYEAAGQSEDDALVQARCAKILTTSEWDEEKQEVKLWSPDNSKKKEDDSKT